jgi:hypothetical protein
MKCRRQYLASAFCERRQGHRGECAGNFNEHLVRALVALGFSFNCRDCRSGILSTTFERWVKAGRPSLLCKRHRGSA